MQSFWIPVHAPATISTKGKSVLEFKALLHMKSMCPNLSINYPS